MAAARFEGHSTASDAPGSVSAMVVGCGMTPPFSQGSVSVFVAVERSRLESRLAAKNGRPTLRGIFHSFGRSRVLFRHSGRLKGVGWKAASQPRMADLRFEGYSTASDAPGSVSALVVGCGMTPPFSQGSVSVFVTVEKSRLESRFAAKNGRRTLRGNFHSF